MPAVSDNAAFEGVTKIFPPVLPGQSPVHALGPIDLGLRKGEFMAVVGPSGCGKTTLLESLAGLTAVTAGEVMFEGTPVRGQPPEGLGVVFQEDASLPWLTVYENVAFGLRRRGEADGEIKSRVEHALRFMGLASFANAYPAQLSGGMRQRMCIARVFVLRPRLILLDEPFGALDQQTRLLMGDELLRLWRETNATVMIITHAIDEAVLLADRVAVMSARPGRIIDLVETNWPRERDSRIVTDPRFGAFTARVWDKLRAESMKAIGRSELAGAA
jgi:NitT/TauT family transport system ATP-binding protein